MIGGEALSRTYGRKVVQGPTLLRQVSRADQGLRLWLGGDAQFYSILILSWCYLWKAAHESQ